MKVLHVFNEINHSGAEVMYAQAGSEFKKYGMELIALSTGDSVGNYTSSMSNGGYEIEHMPLPKLSFFSFYSFILYFASFVQYLKRNNIQVVHIHRDRYFWFFSGASFLSGAVTVRTFHNVFACRKVTWIKYFVERLSAKKLFRVKYHAISKSVYEHEKSYFYNETVKINNWIDVRRFPGPADKNERIKLRKKLSVSNSVFVVTTVGRCTQVKNHSDVIRAISQLKNTDVCYFHLGAGDEEENEKALAKELGLEVKTFFKGNVNNVRDYLIASDVFVMPSLFEGLGISALEAIACGTPVILYNVPGLKDILLAETESSVGVLIEPSIPALKEAMIKMICNRSSEEESKSIGRKMVISEYDLSTNVYKLFMLYKL